MSRFESALDDYRRSHPQLTVRDKITGTGRRIITEKGPDGVTHICYIHENRNSEARFRLQQKYHRRCLWRSGQQQQFSLTGFVEQLFRDGVPAVLASDDVGSVIIRNRTEDIKPTQQHRLIKIESNRHGHHLLIDLVDKDDFNKLERKLEQLEITASPRRS
ncbi:hypothetical protein ACJMK2_043786 [Sinanodonta woodiana]|uniref:Uncharacterized protein n=1 Tax=Sinanodonta woodiana TaxID=1069815 RepID=A0ABD3VXZ7_SINWO